MATPVSLKFSPHPGTAKHPGGQRRLIALSLKYPVMTCPVGRRFGKTQAAKMAIMAHMRSAKQADHFFRAAYCGPTYKAAKREYDEAKLMFGGGAGKGLIAAKSDSELWLKLRPVVTDAGAPNKGSLIQFWSLENHDNLRGDRLDFVVIDEAKDVREDAWEATIKPMLLDRGGHALIIGTPKRDGVGFQWFRREYHRGADSDWPYHASMTGPTEANPFLVDRRLGGDPDRVRRMRMECHDPATEREEYDAEFIEGEGAVFERLEEAFVLPYEANGQHIAQGDAPREGATYIIGYDIGRHDDWAIFSAWDWENQKQVYLERCIRTPFREQLSRLSRLRARYNNAYIYADNNGMGEMMFEELCLLFGDAAFGRKWNQARKEADVARASGLFQRAEWKFLNVPWQQRQFYAYMANKLPGGGYRYEASPGDKDDAVVAACIVAHKVAQGYPQESAREQPQQMITNDGQLNYAWWEERREARERLERLGLT